MSTTSNESSILASIQIQLIQNVMLSRYFTAAGVVVVLYDTILTIEDEVSGIQTHELKLHSLSIGSPGLARAGPFAVSKLLYYINRYWTIASLIAASYRG